MYMSEKSLTTSSQPLKMIAFEDQKSWYNDFVKFTKEILKEEQDYGTIPGVSKPSLFKPGAEKLRFVYGLTVKVDKTDEVVDYDRGILDFTYKATVMSPSGQVLAECEGNANSFESKWGYNWVSEDQIPQGVDKDLLKQRTSKESEFDFAIEKAETEGQYGKPAEYWKQWERDIAEGKAVEIERTARSGKKFKAWERGGTAYRVPNADIMGMKNTIMKMAQKRAFVGAMLIATGASEFFTQDVEDMELFDIAPVTTSPKQEATVVEEGEVVEEPKKVAEKDEADKIADEVDAGLKKQAEKKATKQAQPKEDPATFAQKRAISKLQTAGLIDVDIDPESLSKKEASDVISQASN